MKIQTKAARLQGFTDQKWCLGGDEDTQKPGATSAHMVIVVAIKDGVSVSGKAQMHKEVYSAKMTWLWLVRMLNQL